MQKVEEKTTGMWLLLMMTTPQLQEVDCSRGTWIPLLTMSLAQAGHQRT
jgi:hypothetical protein